MRAHVAQLHPIGQQHVVEVDTEQAAVVDPAALDQVQRPAARAGS